jgi:diaminohydroxyphosphoribosylaminopyrimidine deaminase/5-amino-6-(5-phosphoribosylamino)uracil reductase
VTANGVHDHAHWMDRCLDLARRGAGAVSPNPMVGAVLVGDDGTVLGEGWHQSYGGPHAEAHAIRDAESRHGSEALRSATMYVNLEPCTHHGKTPPCTDLILEKGIPRLVVGMIDPFPAVKGRGIRRMREEGMDVEVGVLPERCRRLNEAFLHHVETGRPLVTLKVAQTLDGNVATTAGDSRWISGKAARTLVHRWRSELDGVLVGSGTARSDDPRLTVRHVDGRQPVRLVLDRTGTLPADRTLFTDAHAGQTVAVLGEDRDRPAYADALTGAGGTVLRVPEVEGGDGEPHLDLKALLRRLGKDGGRETEPMQSLLVEAGPGLATALFRRDLVDRYFCFVAPKLVGTGTPTLGDLGVASMNQALSFATAHWRVVDGDVLLKGYLRSVE